MKFFATLLLLVLLIAAFGAFMVYVPVGPAANTPDAAATYVDIASGTGTRAIAIKLERAGAIRSRFAFDLLRVLKGGKLIAGEYRFNHPAAATEVYARIVRGDVYTIPLTIPEGFNIFDIANAVAAAGLAPRDAFLQAERTRTDLVSDIWRNAPSLEGYLFPDTYRFNHHSTPDTMLMAMVHRFRQAAAKIGLVADINLPRTVTIASLVEKEVNQPAERSLVAGVFSNRLAQGMALATDPSVAYAEMLEGKYRGTIYASDLTNESPYNTYRHAGLPPGPICNPGLAALKAALAPARTDYLYFVADAQGHSQFSATLKEHATQVLTYRKAIGQAATPAKPLAAKRHPQRGK